jgi:hypothetical protein
MAECVFCGKAGGSIFSGKGICDSCNGALFELLVKKNRSALETIIDARIVEALSVL